MIERQRMFDFGVWTSDETGQDKDMQEAQRRNDARGGGEIDLSLTQMRRNPYLAEYDTNSRSGSYHSGSTNSYSSNYKGNTGRVRENTSRKAAAQMRRSVGERPREYESRSREHRQPVREQTQYRAKTSGQSRQPRQSAAAARKKAQARRRQQVIYRELAVLFALGCIAVVAVIYLRGIFGSPQVDATTPFAQNGGSAGAAGKVQGIDAKAFAKHPDWTEDYLTLNEYSRPGETLPEVKNIFVHYTANRNTSAAQNRSYFENLKDNHERSASAHFIIGYEGEILQCIPLNEIAYAVQSRNYDSISIECCFTSKDGSFTQETYDSLIKLLKWLTETYHLTADDILRHYDCGGKKCPVYFVDHEDAWEQLRRDVEDL